MNSERLRQIENVLLDFHNVKQKVACQRKFLQSGPDITFSQWVALDIVGKNKKCSIDEISKALHVSSSAATQLINVLQKKGLVLRKTNPTDKRVSFVELSIKAKKFFNSIKKKTNMHIKKLFSGFTDDELNTFAALIKKLTENV
jgi:MarR family 2-MHQ and catechol resistance regulon transcriptional repressor